MPLRKGFCFLCDYAAEIESIGYAIDGRLRKLPYEYHQDKDTVLAINQDNERLFEK